MENWCFKDISDFGKFSDSFSLHAQDSELSSLN